MNIIYIRAFKDKRLAVIIAAAIVRMGYLGFRYYPLLDDYIQYGIYPTANNPFKEVYLRIGLFSARPLAGLADIYVWGRFWGAMGVALFIITILHAISAYLFILSSDKLDVPLGITFAVIYVLCPINFEGSYWISASSRIIVGLFFISLSTYFLVNNKNFRFFLFQLIAMFLYEQVAVLGFVLAFLIICYKKMWKPLILVIVNFFILIIYYRIFSTMGSYSYRVTIKLFNFDAISDVAEGWRITSLYTSGFLRGVNMHLIYFIPIIITAFSLAFVEKANKFNIKMLIAGIILFIIPYTPFLLLSNNNASFRTSTVPLIGVAIIIDNIFNLLKRAKPVAVCFISFAFFVISVSELCDYRENYIVDRRIVTHVVSKHDKTKTNAVVGAKITYIPVNVQFAEHILSITSSDWALTGCVREYLHDRTVPMIQINPENLDNINLISLYDF